MLSKSMMWIADHPTDTWLEKYLEDHGITAFKFGEAKLAAAKTAAPKEAKSYTKAEAPQTPEEFDAQDALIKHLASKVKA